MKHFGERGGRGGAQMETSSMLWSALLGHIRSPSTAHVKAELHRLLDLPETSHLSDRNFPFSQLRWHWPWDREKWPNSTGKPSAHLKHQGKPPWSPTELTGVQDNISECMWERTHSQAKTSPPPPRGTWLSRRNVKWTELFFLWLLVLSILSVLRSTWSQASSAPAWSLPATNNVYTSWPNYGLIPVLTVYLPKE